MGKGQAGKKVAAGGLRLGPGGVLCCVCKRPPGRVCSVGFHTCGCVCAVGSARIRVDASRILAEAVSAVLWGGWGLAAQMIAQAGPVRPTPLLFI